MRHHRAACVAAAAPKALRTFLTFETAKLEVSEIVGAGLGVRAVERICKGERLYRERALLEMPPSFFALQTGAATGEDAMDCCEADLNRLLKGCREEDQRRFWALHDCHAPDGADKLALGIALTVANTEAASARGGVFPLHARLNHSCTPNAYFSFEEEEDEEEEDGLVQVVHAIRDIEAGEEVCTCYVDVLATREQRQAILSGQFNFSCSCAACSLEGEVAKLADMKRSRLRQLQTAIRAVEIEEVEDVEDLVAMVEEFATLLDGELGGHVPLKGATYYDACRLAMAAGQEDLSEELARLAWECSVVTEGAEAPHSKMLLERMHV